MDTEQFKHIGEELARLHTMSVRRVKSGGSATANWLHKLQRQEMRFIRDLPKLRNLPNDVGRWYRKHGETCIDLGREAWRFTDTPDVQEQLDKEKFRTSLIHGDITTCNIAIRDGEVFLLYGTIDRIYSDWLSKHSTADNRGATIDLRFISGPERSLVYRVGSFEPYHVCRLCDFAVFVAQATIGNSMG